MKQLLVLVILAFVTSCTSLSVKVSTANPESLKNIHDKIDQYEVLAYSYRKVLQPLKNTAILKDKEKINETFDNNIAMLVSNKRISSGNATAQQDSFRNNYATIVVEIMTDYDVASNHLENKNYNQAYNIYAMIPSKFQKLQYNLSEEEVLTDEQKKPIIKEIDTALINVNSVFHYGRANLLGDRLVSYITMKENDTIWKSTYNRTVNRTFFGNADIAVVLNEMPNNYNNNYSIKGVRVDAAKLIQTSFDVMTQVVNVAAAMSGITPASANGDPNSFYPEEFTEIKELPIKTAELQNRKELLSEVQRQLLLKILGENLDQKNTTEIQTSVADIKAFWDSYKLNLNTNTTEP